MVSRCVQSGVYVEGETDPVHHPQGGPSDMTGSGRIFIPPISQSIQAPPLDRTMGFSMTGPTYMDNVSLPPHMDPMTRTKMDTLVEDSPTTPQTSSVSTGCLTGQLFIAVTMKATNTNTTRNITCIAARVFPTTETQGTNKRYIERASDTIEAGAAIASVSAINSSR